MTEGTGQGTGGAGDGTGTGAPAKPWYEGKLDAELIGHLQNVGLADKTPDEVAVAMTKHHREAQKMIGVPADRILKLPAKSMAEAPDEWNAVFQRLGAPAKSEDYKFDGIKFKDGSELEEGFTTFARRISSALHLTPDGSKMLTSELVKYMDAATETEDAETTATLSQQKDALAKNWGPNFEANKFVASQAAQKLGLTQQEIDGLQKLVGYDRIMEMFRKVGAGMGEDIFVRGSGNTGGGVMTRDQAIAKRAELMGDSAWVERYNNGGKKELNEMLAVNTIIAGGAVAA